MFLLGEAKGMSDLSEVAGWQGEDLHRVLQYGGCL